MTSRGYRNFYTAINRGRDRPPAKHVPLWKLL